MPSDGDYADQNAWCFIRTIRYSRVSDTAFGPSRAQSFGLRYGLLRPGPDYALHRPEHEAAQTELLEPASVLERRLRQRIGEIYHRYNAILKRNTGDKPNAHMKVQELEATNSWLERNRLADHAEVLDGNPRYAWTTRQRREWTPAVGRVDGRPRGAPRTHKMRDPKRANK